MGVADAPASSREHLQRRNQKPVPLSASTHRRFLPAADKGRVECLKLLLAAGGDVNKCDNDGRSPIIIASQFGQSAALSAWLLAGGKASHPGRTRGQSPLLRVFKNYPQAVNDSTTYHALQV
jgi:ankyrin repeat protein